MLKHNANNERIKHRYFTYLKEAKRLSEQTLDSVAKALARFEDYTQFKDFKGNITDDTDNGITWWENKRGSNTHTVLFLEEESYVVILAKRRDYYLFRTAYCANPKRKRQLIRERDEYWKARKTKGAC